jgi:antitoxin ParD1/3/4
MEFTMTVSVKLPAAMADYVKAQVASGRYGSADEVLVAALQLHESHEISQAEKLAWLRAAWIEGVDGGDSGPIDLDAFKRDARLLSGGGSLA